MQLGERQTFRIVVAGIVVAVLVAAFRGAEFQVAGLADPAAWERVRSFLAGCWPPRVDWIWLQKLLDAAIDTVATAFLGTVGAMLVGFPLGVFGSRVVTAGALYASGDVDGSFLGSMLFLAARGLSAFFRSIPEVLWALIFVKALGLGAMPAIAALGVAYGGMLGKVYSEQLEAVDPGPGAAIEAVGGSRIAAFAWGMLPQAIGSMAEYTMYRFECAIRASILMGFVGASGLGIQLQYSAEYSKWNEVVTETAILVVIVAVFEAVADLLRRWIG